MPPIVARGLSRLLFFACLACAAIPICFGQESESAKAQLDPSITTFLKEHCVDCHSAPDADGGLDLEQWSEQSDLNRLQGQLRSMRRRVRAHEMPPPSDDGPSPESRRRFVDACNKALEKLAAADPDGPGRVRIRRLSRVEYATTVRDLLGVDSPGIDSLPSDDLGYGFDNIGGALSFSLLHFEKFQELAEDIATRALPDEDPDNPQRRRFAASDLTVIAGKPSLTDHANLYSRAEIGQILTLPRRGEYLIRVRAWGDQAGDEAPRLDVDIGTENRAAHAVAATRAKAEIYESRLTLEAGANSIVLAFRNDFYQPKHPDPKRRDRNLHLEWLEVVGPVDRLPPTKAQQWLQPRGEKKSLAKRLGPVVSDMLLHFWRRPATGAEKRRLTSLIKDELERGGSEAAALQVAVQALLCSPHFLFRVETGHLRGAAGKAFDLDDFHLASRLSYFLWSSTPDSRLLELARKKRLAEEGVLRAESLRMLADERSSALASNFAAQWLEVRSLDDATPDPDRYPGFDAELRESMRRETSAFFEHVLREQRPVSELISADYSFLDQRLAEHYGVKGVEGEALRRVSFEGGRRGGLLGQAAIHVVTSNPTRTSPVKRGKWVLDNLLDAAPPPPPPGNDSFEGGEEAVAGSLGLRRQMELHRRDPNCASCHIKMDAIGLAFENFDVLGRWRTEDRDGKIDASSSLPNGRKIDGSAELKSYLAADPDLSATLAKKLFVYAVGREATPADETRLEQALQNLDPATITIQDLIMAVVTSDAFRRRSPAQIRSK